MLLFVIFQIFQALVLIVKEALGKFNFAKSFIKSFEITLENSLEEKLYFLYDLKAFSQGLSNFLLVLLFLHEFLMGSSCVLYALVGSLFNSREFSIKILLFIPFFEKNCRKEFIISSGKYNSIGILFLICH